MLPFGALCRQRRQNQRLEAAEQAAADAKYHAASKAKPWKEAQEVLDEQPARDNNNNNNNNHETPEQAPQQLAPQAQQAPPEEQDGEEHLSPASTASLTSPSSGDSMIDDSPVSALSNNINNKTAPPPPQRSHSKVRSSNNNNNKSPPPVRSSSSSLKTPSLLRGTSGPGDDSLSHHSGHSTGDHYSVVSASLRSTASSTVLPPRQSTSLSVTASHCLPETSTHQISAHRLEDLTIDKLQFERVGLVGREREVERIQKLFHQTMTTTKEEEEEDDDAAKVGATTETSGLTEEHQHHNAESLVRPQDSGGGGGRRRRRRHRSLLLIGGAAGTGKSRVALQALEPLLQENQPSLRQQRNQQQHQHVEGLGAGLLLRGKHEQQLADQTKPYAAVALCCEDLCEALIGRLSSADLKELRAKLQTALGSDAALLTDVLPSLLPLVGMVVVEPAPAEKPEEADGSGPDPKEEVPKGTNDQTNNNNNEGSYVEAKARFNSTFRRFLRVVCDLAPTVLLVDDLQWCDESSFSLLESLLKDSENDRLLLVGTYRPDEIANVESHRLTHFQRACQEEASHSNDDNCLTVETILLGNLTLDMTVRWLVELLSSSVAAVRPLAECVHAKTLGNAFFTVQFLKTLRQLKFLTFNFGTLAWSWNIEEIDQGTEATENVADLVRAKMQTLPLSLQRILPLMASLGSFFRVDLFRMVMVHVRATRTTTTTNGEQESSLLMDDEEVLNMCMEEGFIEQRGTETYHWIHDKVEEAALNLVSQEALETLQFDLATSFLEQMSDQVQKENIFILVYLFRTCSEHLSPEDPRRASLAKLRHECGLQAFRASAFGQAAVELEAAVELLSTDTWQTDYDFCLELYSTAAEANFCIGRLDTVEVYAGEILQQTENKPTVDRKRVYNVQVRSLMAAGRLPEAIDLILRVLAELGVKFRKNGATISILTKLLRARKNVDDNVSKLALFPHTMNETKAWSIFLLDRLMACWFVSKSPLLPLTVLTALEIVLEEGSICNFASNHIATTGLLIAAALNDVKAGSKYAQEALAIVDDPGFKHCKAQTCMMAYNFVLSKILPVEETRKGLLRGYDSGIAHGDSEFACWCLNAYLEQTVLSGSKLEPLIRDCGAAFRESEGFQQFQQGTVTLLVWQFALNMVGQSAAEDPLVFTGEAMDEEDWIQKNVMGDHWEMLLGRYKLYAAVILGAHDQGMELILKYGFDQRVYEKAFPGSSSIPSVYFHTAVTAVSMARRSQRSRNYTKIASKFGRDMKAWADEGNPNVQHYSALISAELTDLRGDTSHANELYQRAILLSARRGLRQDRALAHERYGDFHLRQLDEVSAGYQYQEAMRAYQEWGAAVKVERMQRQLAELLPNNNNNNNNN